MFQHSETVSLSALLKELGHQRGPPGLVAGSQARAVVTMEKLVKPQVIAEMGVVLIFFRGSEHRTLPGLVAKEDARQPARQLRRHIAEILAISRIRRELDHEVVAEVVVEFLQRLDEQKIYREPYRTPPVG